MKNKFFTREICVCAHLTQTRYAQKACAEMRIKMEEKTAMRYTDAKIDERILRALAEIGFENMTPIQEQAIPKLLEGKDIIGQAQTGTGKTAAFGIPMIQMADPEDRSLQALVLCPTRELAMQAAEELRRFAKYLHGVRILPVYGGQEIFHQIKALKGGVQIVVGTPGRVMDHLRRKTLRTDNLKMLVLDEADEMLNMGFREDIETILQQVPETRQTALFSATMPKPILDITSTYQKPDAEYIKLTKDEVTINLVKQCYYYIKRDQKEEVLCRLMDYYQPKRSLIFCNTKRMVDELAQNLKARGYSADGLHGDLTQGQRDTVMNLFRSGHTAILIATDVAARGIDVDNVEAVFNYDVPDDIEYYVHRIGRTGRAGKTGRSFTLVVGREVYKIRDIERICKTQIQERTVPSAQDVTRRKAEKILREVDRLIASEDLTQMKGLLSHHLEESGYTVLDVAAAFLKQQMGDELEEIVAERPRRRGSREEDGRRRRTDRREDNSRGRRGARDNERNGRRDTEGRGWKSTRKMGERGEKPSRRRNEERDLRRVKDVDRNGMPKKPHTSGKLRKGTPVKGKMSFTEYSKKHDL